MGNGTNEVMAAIKAAYVASKSQNKIPLLNFNLHIGGLTPLLHSQGIDEDGRFDEGAATAALMGRGNG